MQTNFLVLSSRWGGLPWLLPRARDQHHGVPRNPNLKDSCRSASRPSLPMPRPRRRPSAPSSVSTYPRGSRWPSSGISAMTRPAPAPRRCARCHSASGHGLGCCDMMRRQARHLPCDSQAHGADGPAGARRPGAGRGRAAAVGTPGDAQLRPAEARTYATELLYNCNNARVPTNFTSLFGVKRHAVMACEQQYNTIQWLVLRFSIRTGTRHQQLRRT
jgi:hypothetical protein